MRVKGTVSTCACCGEQKRCVDSRRPDIDGKVCSACRRDWRREHEPGYKEKIRGINSTWTANNLEKAKASDARWDARNPEYHHGYGLLKKYGLTPEEYDKMFIAQRGVCAICGQPETMVDGRTGNIRRLAVDHEHVDGFDDMSPEEKKKYIRQLLCCRHNSGSGFFADDSDLLRRMADSIDRHRDARLNAIV